MGHHPGIDDGFLGQRTVLPHTPFVSMTPGGVLEAESGDVGAQTLVHDEFEGHIGRVRAVPRTPTDMKAGLLTWHVTQRAVDGVNAARDKSLEVSDIGLGVDAIPDVGKLWGVNLHGQAGVGDGLILLTHGIGGRAEEFFLCLVEAVADISRHAWGNGGHETLLGASRTHGFAQQVRIPLHQLLAGIGQGRANIRGLSATALDRRGGAAGGIGIKIVEELPIPAGIEGSDASDVDAVTW